MKILAVEKEMPEAGADRCKPLLKPEARRVWELYQAGVLRELYFNADCHKALLVLECRDVAEARQVLDGLPLVENGLIEFEIIPLVAYPGFERLFAPPEEV
jgi:muconolactone delta-isomerase